MDLKLELEEPPDRIEDGLEDILSSYGVVATKYRR